MTSLLLGLLLAIGSPQPNRPVYHGIVSLDPATRTISASWRIELARTGAMRDTVRLFLNEGLRISRLNGAAVAGYRDTTEDGSRTLVVGLRGSGDFVIDIAYSGAPTFGTDSINGMSGRWVELGLDSYWLPIVADYAQRITGDVKVLLPRGWKVAASGSTTSKGDTLMLTQTVPLIDMAFTASPMLGFVEQGRTRVYYDGSAPAVLPAVMSIATACRSALNGQFATRDSLPPIRMVFAPRGGPGYARKNYIVITNAADTNTVALERFICHELAHFWSSNAISSGPENWLNEAFAEYVAGRYVRDAEGDEAYTAVVLKKWRDNSSNAGPIWTETTTRRPTARASYNKAPALLDSLEQQIGREKMNTFLRRYMGEGIGRTSSLLAMLASVAGAETAAWFKTQLGVP